MKKQWFSGHVSAKSITDATAKLAAFANKNNLLPGDIHSVASKEIEARIQNIAPKDPFLVYFMYFAEKSAD